MSSMLKKAGAGAFKPKAPMARRRPAPNAAVQATQPSQSSDAQGAVEIVQEPTPVPSQDVAAASHPTESQPERLETPKSTTDAPASSSAKSSEPRRRASGSANSPSFSTAPENSTESAAAAQVHDLRASSTNSEATPDSTNAAISSRQRDTPVANPSSATTTSGRGTSASRTNPSPSQAAQGPQPAAGTSILEAAPDVAERSLLTPSTTSVTPSIEDSEINLTDTASNTAKPTRKSQAKQPRKRKAATATGDDDAVAESAGVPRKKRATRKKATTTNGTDVEAEEGEVSVNKRRPQRKPKTTKAVEGHTGEQEGGRDANDENAETETIKPRKRGRKRSVTPEDAENITIDPDTITLGQLTRDPRTGKRWDKAALILASEQERKRERQRQQLIEKGLLKEGEDLPGSGQSEAGTPAPDPSKAPASAPEPAAPPPPAATGGLRYRIVDGQIVLDDTTLQHDRHAEADEARGDLEAREEHEFSRRTTQYTLMRRKTHGNSWTSQDTERFYNGLRSFGTDFEMISQMFGGSKSRRQIKLKFNREERQNPAAVNRCLVGEKTVPMTLDAIHGFETLEETDAIKDELAREREEREAEARREEEERAAENRQKAADLGGRGKKARDRARAAEGAQQTENDANEQPGATRAKSKQKDAVHPGAKYGVGTDPDVIDETDLPTASGRGGRSGRGRGRGGRRGGMLSFGSGFGA